MLRKSVLIPSAFFLISSVVAGCGKDNSKAGATPKSHPQPLSQHPSPAGTSNELAGTWVSPCFAFVQSKYATATYIFRQDGTADFLNQIYFDDSCRDLARTEQLRGTVSYGDAVTSSTEAKKIDFTVDGQSTVKTIYSLKEDSLCFGNQSSPVVDGRPSEITCSKPFRRL